jgi:hypothetical protein
VIHNVYIHLNNEQPLVADLEDMPAGTDRSIRCTNVRTVDGKRPSFVHEKESTFVFPLATIRLIEVPSQAGRSSDVTLANVEPAAASAMDDSAYDEPLPAYDEEPDEDLLARIRSV